MTDPVQTVQGIYRAFGQGDIPAIVDALAPDVDWDPWPDSSAQKAGVPTLLHRRGRDAVLAFFNEVGKLEFHEFKVVDVFGSGSMVAGPIEVDFSVPATGARLRDEELHLWSFGADGKVVRFRDYVDTAKHMRAHGRAMQS